MNYLEVSIRQQQLSLYMNSTLIKTFRIGTAKKGAGEQYGSQQTPRGRHIILEKIGEGAPFNTVFKARKPTGELFTPELFQQYPGRDWMLSRILWLGGLEPGKNQGGEVDTERRYIYIHGSPDSALANAPASHGCINMFMADMVELFDLVKIGTDVNIKDV